MNMRKAIPLLVIASMMLSLIPSAFFAYAVAGPALNPAAGQKGATVKVTGAAGTVPAGTTVEIYWDTTTGAWDGTKGLLNSTLGKASGAYEVWFKVPEAVKGTHYVWVKTAAGETASTAFTVNTKESLSPSSGLRGDITAVTIYGFGGSKDVRLVYTNGTIAWPQTAVAPAAGPTGNGATTTFSGTIANTPIVPGTLAIKSLSGTGAAPNWETFTDGGTGTLTGNNTGTGSINYVTGAWSVTFGSAPSGATSIGYSYYAGANFYSLNAGTTNSVGTLAASATIPSWAITGQLAAIDAVGNTITSAFTVGPVITLSPAVGVVGQVITVSGRGFTPVSAGGWTTRIGKLATNVQLKIGATVINNIKIKDLPTNGVPVDSTGRFTMQIIVPSGTIISDTYSIQVTSNATVPDVASADFEITKLSDVSVDPTHATQGTQMTVSGYGFPQISGTTVYVDLFTNAPTPVYTVNIGSTTTGADGSILANFNVPAVADGSYLIRAASANVTTGATIMNTTAFIVGTIYMQLSATSGPTGKVITITGNGFTIGGDWNATIGSKTLVSSTASPPVSGAGLINYNAASIPQMDPGTYTVTVRDVSSGITLSATFTVTYTTEISFSPNNSPHAFNVSVSGRGFWQGGAATGLTFTIYNKTSTGTIDRTWPMTVRQNWQNVGGVAVLPMSAQTNTTGNVRAYWEIPASTILSKGTYYINVTDSSANAYKAQTTFTIGDKHIVFTPRKTSFAAGEIISFQMEHTFGNVAPIVNSVVKVYNPSGVLVFSGDPLAGWIRTGDWYTLPYSAQTASGNQMTLADDAPTGTWTATWADANGDTVASTSFTSTPLGRYWSLGHSVGSRPAQRA